MSASVAREALRTWLRDELASERGFITGSVDHIADKLLAAFPALTPAGPEEQTSMPERTAEEAVEKALLYVFQLSDKDYRKMQAALSEVAFIRALEQDGWTVAPIADTGAEERLRAALDLAARMAQYFHSSTHGNGGSFRACSNARCSAAAYDLAALHDSASSGTDK